MSSTAAENLAAWIGVPVALYAIGLGIGLLTERLARTRVPNALLPPLGICTAIVVLMPIYKVGIHGWVPPLVLVALTVAGLVLGRADLSDRARAGAAAIAGVLVYLAYLAPTAFSGHWTWTGYNFVNDTAVQLMLAQYVNDHGSRLVDFERAPNGVQPLTTHDLTIEAYIGTDYPLGSHQLLGSLSELLFSPPEVLYQGFVAGLVALGAMALAVLARRSGLSRTAAVGVAIAAALANLLYQYGLQGNVKEVAFFAAFATSAALARELLGGERPVGTAACVGIGAAAAVAVYSAAAVPFVGLLAIVLAAYYFLSTRKTQPLPLGRVIAAGAGAFAVASAAAFVSVVGFSDTAQGTYGGASEEIGHLLRPLPLIQSAGVWLAGNYRGPIDGNLEADLTTAIQWVVVAGLVIGVVLLLRRREPGPLLYLLPSVLTAILFVPRLSPYADAKIYVAMTAGIVFVAAFGMLCLPGPWRWLGRTAAVVVAAGLLVGAGFAYHDVNLAPTERMKALEDVGERFAGKGPMLFVESDEFAKYFARDAKVNTAFEALSPLQVQLRDASGFEYSQYYDLDRQKLSYVEAFPYVIQRRSPDASRPPADYEQVYRNEYYAVWQRRGPRRVREHLPLQDVHTPAIRPDCGDVRRMAQRARPGESLVALERPELAQFDVRNATDRSPGWPANGDVPGVATAATQGGARGSVEVDGGRYRVWMRGSFGRPVDAIVDGRVVGTAQGINAPGGWFEFGTLDLRPGRHKTAVFRGGGSLAPGNGAPSIGGPLAFERIDTGGMKLRWFAPEDAEQLCGKPWDWIELARGPQA